VTVDGVLLKDGGVTTDTIIEESSAAGVTIDGFKAKDGGFIAADGATGELDTLNEATSAAGVTVDGVLIKDGGIVLADAAVIEADTVNEATSAAGVTADGVLLKDGYTNARLEVQELTATGAITAKRHALVMLNHATVIIEATLAAPAAGDEMFIVNSSASGTAAHTVTVGAGVTLDGTNTIATLNAPNEALHLVALSATRWFILENIGSVALS
jgi:hypothetical protein